MDEKFTHPPNGEGWKCEMSDIVEKLVGRVETVEKDTAILSKEFELFGGWFRESLNSLKETTSEIKEGNDLLRESLYAQKLEMEYKFKELELKQVNREQAYEIKKLTNAEKFKAWWENPDSLLSKLGLMFGGVLALALANHYNVLEEALKLLVK